MRLKGMGVSLAHAGPLAGVGGHGPERGSGMGQTPLWGGVLSARLSAGGRAA